MKLAISRAVLLLPLLLSGCVVVPAEREGLPTGVTLLDSDTGECDGTLEIESNPDIRVDEGEDTVVAVADDEEIEWQCETDLADGNGEFECPDDTSHVRVSREEDDSEFSLECYGV